jgi:formylmethanofuran dehydrogenase subunit E
MPVEELLAVQPVTLTVSLAQIISQHGLRVNCSICGEEIMNSREEQVNGQPVCRSCAGQAYYKDRPEASMWQFSRRVPDLTLA